LLRLIGSHVLDEIEASRQNFGDLGLGVRNEAQLDIFDLRRRLRAVLGIIRIAREPKGFPHCVLHDPVRARPDRLLVHALRPDLGIIFVRVNYDWAGQIFDCRRERPSGHNAHAVRSEFFDMVDPINVALRRRLVFRL